MIPLAAFEASLAFGWAGLACLVFPVSTVRAFRFLTVRGSTRLIPFPALLLTRVGYGVYRGCSRARSCRAGHLRGLVGGCLPRAADLERII